MPAGPVTVGSYGVPMNVKFDYENPETYFKSNYISTNPFDSTFARLYNPRDSVGAE